jgi:hypothetical protein
MRQEQLYAPALLDILLLYLGLGPCLYITTQYLKWSILLSNKSKMIDHFVIDHHIASQHHTRLYSAQYYAQYLLDLDSADFRQSACGRGRAARRTASWRRVAYTPNTNDVATITSTCTTMLELRHLHGLLTEATAGSRTLADGKASMYGGLR